MNNSTFDQHFVNKNSQKNNKSTADDTLNNSDLINLNTHSIRDNIIDTRNHKCKKDDYDILNEIKIKPIEYNIFLY